MHFFSGANRALPVAAASLLCACTANGILASPHVASPSRALERFASRGKMQHAVIVVQENRSFNNLFYGFPGAKTARYGHDTYGNKIALQPIGLETRWDLDHSSTSFFEACNGTGSIPGTNCRMNGFNQEWVGCGQKCPIKHPQYAYVPYSETKPYFVIGKQYVLADRMYASNFDASSFISHQCFISGQALSAVNYPDAAWGCPGGSGDKIPIVGPQRQIPQGSETVCWDSTTLADELDKAGVWWAYYATAYAQPGIWSAYQAIKHIYYGADWNSDVITPPSRFLTDVTNGNLRAVTWVTPTCADSNHAGCGANTGPSWIASIVNTIGQSQYWDSTAIFIVWDDYGGWYDSQAPAYVDYDGLGLRIPMLIVSAYAKQGYVSHVHYEHGSILKFVEDIFGLPRLSASDTRATSPARDCFNFRQKPRAFVPIQAPHDANFFKHQRADSRIPDWK